MSEWEQEREKDVKRRITARMKTVFKEVIKSTQDTGSLSGSFSSLHRPNSSATILVPCTSSPRGSAQPIAGAEASSLPTRYGVSPLSSPQRLQPQPPPPQVTDSSLSSSTTAGDQFMPDSFCQPPSHNDLCVVVEAVFIHGLKPSRFGNTSSTAGPRRRALTSLFQNLSSTPPQPSPISVSMEQHQSGKQPPEPNFLPFLLTHLHRDIIEELFALSFVQTDVGRCRAWIRLVLNESLLSSHLRTMLGDKKSLEYNYNPEAYLRDREEPSLFLKWLDGIESASKLRFRLQTNSSLLNTWSPPDALVLAGMWSPSPAPDPVIVATDALEAENRRETQSRHRRHHRRKKRKGLATEDSDDQRSMMSSVMGGTVADDVRSAGSVSDVGSSLGGFIMDNGEGEERLADMLKRLKEYTALKEEEDGEVVHTDRKGREEEKAKEGDEDGEVVHTGRKIRGEEEKEEEEKGKEEEEGEVIHTERKGREEKKGKEEEDGEVVHTGKRRREEEKGKEEKEAIEVVHTKRRGGEGEKGKEEKKEEDGTTDAEDIEEGVEVISNAPTTFIVEDEQPKKLNSEQDQPKPLRQVGMQESFNSVLWGHQKSTEESTKITIVTTSEFQAMLSVEKDKETPDNVLTAAAEKAEPTCEDLGGEATQDVSRETANDTEPPPCPLEAEEKDEEINNAAVVEEDDGLGDVVCPMKPLPGPIRSVEQFMEDLLPLMVHIPLEKGLDQQGYQCKKCVRPIGMIYGKERLCNYDGKYYCYECHQNDKAVIPARIVHNWDFTPRDVSIPSLRFLKAVEKVPLLDIPSMNPLLAKMFPEVMKIQALRQEVASIWLYISTCRFCTIVGQFKALLHHQTHLYLKPGLYSIEDLVSIPNGVLESRLTEAAALGKKHIMNSCRICHLKGFVCELCHDAKIIFPFDADATQCQKCHNVCHSICLDRRQDPSCPKCTRRAEWKRRQQLQDQEATLDVPGQSDVTET
ncbi:unnamed protein product [Cyprideis torosa]|uniref:Uncharacterized protein n=1 Tax=Cyprideis torosa TaxID=163714 RepID=A0A7R8WLQ6_9CRUS|nr:unnamed protein product [Cyprideis torosa]CAG0898482.1 unnamed protein product [Cyprideis torosa]